MDRARSGSGTIILCGVGLACLALLVQTGAFKLPGLSMDGRSVGPDFLSRPPPSLASDANWKWASAVPGGNIYIESRGKPDSGPLVSAWTARRLIDSQAGIAQDRLELIQFDCHKHMTRPVVIMLPYRGLDGREHMDAHPAGDVWGFPRPESALVRLLDMACAGRQSGTHGTEP